MDNQKRYWKGLEELSNDLSFVKQAENEFPDLKLANGKAASPVDGSGTNRRDFLKMLGFGVSAASLAACEAPVVRAIPYLNKPEEITPGIANWYASSYVNGGEYCSVLVKTREGRPIKIEGNRSSAVTKGGTTARVQASVLSLYDDARAKSPLISGRVTDWKTIDAQIIAELTKLAAAGRPIRLVSSTVLSPTIRAVIADFVAKYPTARHLTYDANSASAMVAANQASFGKAVIPSYDFSKAGVIVGLGADFLGTWLSPVTFATQYADTRRLHKEKRGMSRHYQFETTMSLTGSNADYRTTVKPSQEGLVVANLYNKVAKLAGQSALSVPALDVKWLDEAAKDLFKARGAALVVSGSNDVATQTLVSALNALLGSYGHTIDLTRETYYKQGSDADMAQFVADAAAGRVGAALFFQANPVYDHPAGAKLAAALPKISLTVSFADRVDETAAACKYLAPDSHYLESWNDAEPARGFLSLGQPTISRLFNTRQAPESLLRWSGSSGEYYDYLRNRWRATYFPLQSRQANFDKFWEVALHDGVFEPTAGLARNVGNDSTAVASAAPVPIASGSVSFNGDVAAAARAVASVAAASKGIELSLYEKISLGTGNQANNPWLQELPDPVSKVTWDNYLTMPKKMASELSLVSGDVVKLEVGGKSIDIPVLVQPGQANGTVSLAIGYGRTKAGRAADGVGKNAYPFATMVGNHLAYFATDVRLTKTEETLMLAQTQTHQTIMGRHNVQGGLLKEYQQKPNVGRVYSTVETSQGPKQSDEMSLWTGHLKKNHSWGMVIDLNTCIGCAACVVACQAENNVAVVGRQEVARSREMHWIRIDRYYSSQVSEEEAAKAGPLNGPGLLEEAADNPEVVFQPMLCQHCSNAPCETVCPVLATTHSSEGINQMTYNRCIGTRYCANNCPYKVRRFNWFKYFEEVEHFPNNPSNYELGKMVLNPDVTVRSRGVMEKCTFCIQRIQDGKLNAKKEKRTLEPNEVVTACAQACPTNAIVFGDMNNPESNISLMLAEQEQERAFVVLEELNVRPQISYLTKIKNQA